MRCREKTNDKKETFTASRNRRQKRGAQKRGGGDVVRGRVLEGGMVVRDL